MLRQHVIRSAFRPALHGGVGSIGPSAGGTGIGRAYRRRRSQPALLPRRRRHRRLVGYRRLAVRHLERLAHVSPSKARLAAPPPGKFYPGGRRPDQLRTPVERELGGTGAVPVDSPSAWCASRGRVDGIFASVLEAGGAAPSRSRRRPRKGLGMGVGNDDAVLIKVAKEAGEASVITVNCPDKTGLGCDLCRIILEFGLRITRGDVSTDGRWCYLVYWVVPRSDRASVHWVNLKNRLLSACPSSSISFYFNSAAQPSDPEVYLLKMLCVDRNGLLHDVTQILCELDIIIQRVKVSTTPDGRVVDLFFITDGMELLHTKQRREEACAQLNAVLGESCEACEIQLAGPEYEILQQGCSSLPPPVADVLFSPELSEDEARSQAVSAELAKLEKSSVVLDNSLSPAHTLLQVHCVDQKGLLYDILRTLKDCNLQIAYGRFLSDMKGYREVDVFIQQSDGKKMVDPEKQRSLCSRLRTEMLHPLRVMIANRGPDTELLVANPVELCGRGRPRVFYDVTLALKVLGICIFSAEIGRHSTNERQWEVYRFLLDETRQQPLSNSRARRCIVDRVRKTLMGWN